MDAARFRPTVVVDVGETAFVEDSWIGRELRLGDARIRLGIAVPRCAVIDLDPATGERDARVLKALGAIRPADGPLQLSFGLDASVVRAGTVRRGDDVVLGD